MDRLTHTASCIVIGNEILSGKIHDTNSHHLARWLRPRGIDLMRVQTIPDVIGTIANTVIEESSRSNVVFTSGGVGPTHDDVTYRAVAEAFGLKQEKHAEVLRRMEAVHGAPPSSVRARMADLPSPAALHFTDTLWVPIVQVRNVFVLPGIPMLFERLLNSLQHVLRGPTPRALHSVFTWQVEEELAPLLEAVLQEHPGVEIGSYPRVDPGADHHVRVTLESRDTELCLRATSALLQRLESGKLVRVER
jgi:molybdenum cofactor synthesis domain-containing protein